MLALEDLLPDAGDHDGVVGIVVGRVRVGDVLQRHAADGRERAGRVLQPLRLDPAE